VYSSVSHFGTDVENLCSCRKCSTVSLHFCKVCVSNDNTKF